MPLRRGKNWIRARLSWLVLFGLGHAILLWDGNILLAYGLIALLCWRMIRNAKEVSPTAENRHGAVPVRCGGTARVGLYFARRTWGLLAARRC